MIGDSDKESQKFCPSGGIGVCTRLDTRVVVPVLLSGSFGSGE